MYGEDGIDTLDLTEFAQEAVSVNVYLNTNIGTIMYNRYGYSGFQINSVERVLGRKAKADHIFSACETKFLDGNGGKEDQLDYLEIKDNNCVYDIQVIVRNYTEVNNLALKGNFNYIVPFQKVVHLLNYLLISKITIGLYLTTCLLIFRILILKIIIV